MSFFADTDLSDRCGAAFAAALGTGWCVVVRCGGGRGSIGADGGVCGKIPENLSILLGDSLPGKQNGNGSFMIIQENML